MQQQHLLFKNLHMHMDSTVIHHMDFATHSFQLDPSIVKAVFLHVDEVQIVASHH